MTHSSSDPFDSSIADELNLMLTQHKESKSGHTHKASYQASDAANSLPANAPIYKYHLKAD
ncbi:MAG: hypothetical protein NTU52_05150 [Actinobacteria bacterium]|nr:hypothetical protein [Actinomycetota bacterium]